MNNFPEAARAWSPILNWESAPGSTLRELGLSLDLNKAWLIDVFGSAPLEMAYGPDFVSADVDAIFPLEDYNAITQILDRIGFSRGNRAHYVQACPQAAFRTSPKWKDRVFITKAPEGDLGQVTYRFAHPIDIILGKLNRLDEKDWRSIHMLREITGGPKETDLLLELQDAPDLFSLAFLSNFGPSFRENIESFWEGYFGRSINLEKEIFQSIRIKMAQAYHEDR